MHLSSLSLFRDFITVPNVYKKLQSEQITLDQWYELDRREKNLKAGLFVEKLVGRSLKRSG